MRSMPIISKASNGMRFAPDGTSGFYFLSRRLLVPGSENVYIELSPLNDPGNVVARQSLRLGTDYEVDYDRGTLLFKDPVLRTQIDSEGNVFGSSDRVNLSV